MDDKMMDDLILVRDNLKELIDALGLAAEKAIAHVKLIREKNITKETYTLAIAAQAPELMAVTSKFLIEMTAIKEMAENLMGNTPKEPTLIIPNSRNQFSKN